MRAKRLAFDLRHKYTGKKQSVRVECIYVIKLIKHYGWVVWIDLTNRLHVQIHCESR